MTSSGSFQDEFTDGPRLKIAMIGTRGVPAAYGGFETAVEEIGRRLVERGHEVVVYCRSTDAAAPDSYLGMSLVHLPALRSKYSETLSHTALSVAHLAVNSKPDAAFVFNAANAPMLPAIRASGVPVAVHVDGLEWKRGKWGPAGRKYYRMAEQLAVHWADALIADAKGISDYYTEKFGVETELLTYGAKIIDDPGSDRLSELGLVPGRFHLVVARFEPENHVDVIVDGYAASDATYPLVVVGSAPYAAAYTDRIAAVAASDPRIRMLGGVWDQDVLDQLYAGALTYIHGHSVGGTNPSLLRAMGAGTAVLAWRVNFNHEVVDGDAGFFSDSSDVRALVEDAEADPSPYILSGERLRQRAAVTYVWDDIATGYEQLAMRLASRSPMTGGRSSRAASARARAHKAQPSARA